MWTDQVKSANIQLKTALQASWYSKYMSFCRYPHSSGPEGKTDQVSSPGSRSGCINVVCDQACQTWFYPELQAEMSHVSTANCSGHYVMHNFIRVDRSWAAELLHSSFFVFRDELFACLPECVFVFVTWPCQSTFQCKPFHRQLPAPDPEIQWPHPQTAASVINTHTKDASYSSDGWDILYLLWRTKHEQWVLQSFGTEQCH